MSRWEPNARGRLQEAAMALFHERSYAETTVVDIAARAGLTERTFFRYFADKREVLFGGAEILEAKLVEVLASAPLPPMAAIATALHAITALQQTRPGFETFARRRHALIHAHAELHERERSKLAYLVVATAKALRRRGVEDPAATLAAEAGIAAFKVAFERWVTDAKRRSIDVHLAEALGSLEALFATPPAAAGRPSAPRTRRRAPARRA